MTRPSALDPATVAAESATALVNNADRLGLTWIRRLATVANGTDAGAISATFDGDTEPIDMVSMIGELPTGQRVYVDIVPPGGNFIVGLASSGVIGVRARSTATSVTSGVITNMNWDVIDEEVGGDFIAAPSIFIDVPVDGVYSLHAWISSASVTNVVRNILQVATVTAGVVGMPTSPARMNYVTAEGIASLDMTSRWNAGDQFVIQVFQGTAASPVNVAGWFSMYRVGP